MRPVHCLFEVQRENTPDHPAVKGDGASCSYREVDRRANQLAHHLRKEGVGADTPVGLCVSRSVDRIVSVLGILKAGGAYVPLDPSYPGDRLNYMLNHSGAGTVITEDDLLPKLPISDGSAIRMDADRSLLDEYPDERPGEHVSPENLAFIIYTSGSTGKPKGVAMPHAPLCRLINWQVDTSEVTTGKTLQFAPISFDVSFQEIFATFAAGGTLVLLGESERRNPKKLLERIDEKGINRLFLPYVALRQLAREGVHLDRFPDTLDEVYTAGEQLRITPEIRTWFKELSECTLENQYGPTETHVVTAHTLSSDPEEWPQLPPIGTALPHTSIHLLSENLEPVEEGVEGEVFIAGECLAREYLDRPDLTEEQFLTAPASIRYDGRLYRTGDLAKRSQDGTLQFLGRKDEQLKIRGYRIEPGEVEGALEQHQDVDTAVVKGFEKKPGTTRLAAYILPSGSESTNPDVSSLREHLTEFVPSYMVPSQFVFVQEIPLTPSGKIDRRSLPDPGSGRPELDQTYVEPVSETENVLTRIWEAELGYDRVGVEDDFFELGGDSINAVSIVATIRERFDVDLPVHMLFDQPTISELAENVDQYQETEAQVKSVEKVSRDQKLPLSYAQEQLWFLQNINPDSPAYNYPFFFRLSGSVNPDILESSLQTLIQRYEILRTTFPEHEGKPYQSIQDDLSWSLQKDDLTHVPESDRNKKLQDLLESKVNRPFDLSDGPLFRAGLVRLDHNEHALWLNLHHIVTDAHSMEVFFNDLSEIYASRRAGEQPDLPEVDLHYADYSVWQREELLTGERFDRLAEWWGEELQGAPPVHGLPTDQPRPATQTYHGNRVPFEWSKDLTNSLRELGRQYNMTLTMVFLTGFAALVRRYSDDEELVVGIPTDGRDRVELDDMPGFLVNTLPVYLTLKEAMSFDDLLTHVRDVSLEAIGHDDLPFEQIIQELDLDRNASHNPLVQLAIAPQPPGERDLRLDDLSVQNLEVPLHTSIFDLTLFYREGSDLLEGAIEYNTDLFERDTVQRMLEHMHTLFEAVVDRPGTHLNELPLMTQQEQTQLSSWNSAEAPIVTDRTVQNIIEEQVQETPGAKAVVEAGGDTLTYEELNHQANKLAQFLIEKGIQTEELVALSIERSTDLIVAMLGVLKSGGAYVPIDPTYPEERVEMMLDDAQPELVITQSRFKERMATVEESKCIMIDRQQSCIDEQPEDVPERRTGPDQLAYIIYTSGSTGRPKGVMVEHRSVVNLIEATRPAFGVDGGDRVLQFASPNFDVSVSDIGLTLTAGATLVLPPPGRKLLGAELGRYMRDQEITVAPLPPAVLPDVPNHLAEEIHTMIVAGEACPAEVVENWSPGRRFINAYGPTEATVYTTFADCEPTGEAPSIGRPIDNVNVYVLDDAGNQVPVGIPGELYIGGAGVARGYLNRPELNERHFVPDPFTDHPDDQMYKTGDIVRWRSDGQLAFLGRQDSQVQLRGYRIELEEIEEHLRSHDEVGQGSVIVRTDESTNRRLFAYVTPESEDAKSSTGKSGSDASLEERLQQYLEQKLPKYMVPAEFVILDELPINTSGKIDRSALPDPERVDKDRDRNRNIVLPRTDVESELASIWADLLELERVGINEQFFDLGGTSLMIARLAYQIEERIGAEVEMRALYDKDTIRELAERIEEEDSSKEFSDLCFSPSLDLEDEAALDETFTGDTPRKPVDGEPGSIFLTGGTGFVGAHLLAELLETSDAQVYALVRSRDDQHALERLNQEFRRYELGDNVPEERILPVVGDLSEPKMGLNTATFEAISTRVDKIFHAGAKVDHVRGYHDMKPANVTGTREILRFASNARRTPLHFISTLDAVHPSLYEEKGVVPESAPPGPLDKLPNGYMQSKCVAENMVQEAMERGIPATIYRLGTVTGQSQSGICASDDFLYSSLRTVIELGCADDLNPDMAITPVDFVARAVAALSRREELLGNTLHIKHPEPSYWRDLLEVINDEKYAVDLIPYQELLQKIQERARTGEDLPIMRFLPFLKQRFPGNNHYILEDHFAHVKWGCDRTVRSLSDLEVTPPPSHETLLRRYLNYLESEGLLETPEQPESDNGRSSI